MLGHLVRKKSFCGVSSMDWARSEMVSVPDGTVFLADEYGVARGSNGRVWQIFTGQICATFVLKPKIQKKDDKDFLLRHLNMALSVGIAKILSEYGVGIKYPNDFIFFPPSKMVPHAGFLKVGGMLMEIFWSGQDKQEIAPNIVFGFSINVNNIFSKNDNLYKVATSLRGICNKKIDKNFLQKRLFLSIDEWYSIWKCRDFEKISEIWNKLAFKKK